MGVYNWQVGMGRWSEWWWWCARPGRLPRAAPLSILLATILTLISLLFLLNAKGECYTFSLVVLFDHWNRPYKSN